LFKYQLLRGRFVHLKRPKTQDKKKTLKMQGISSETGCEFIPKIIIFAVLKKLWL